jgi:hypothetical protein
MKDFLGQDMNVGDLVVACVPHGRNSGASLVKGTVLGFTSHFVKVNIPDYNDKKVHARNISPEKLVKFECHFGCFVV